MLELDTSLSMNSEDEHAPPVAAVGFRAEILSRAKKLPEGKLSDESNRYLDHLLIFAHLRVRLSDYYDRTLNLNIKAFERHDRWISIRESNGSYPCYHERMLYSFRLIVFNDRIIRDYFHASFLQRSGTLLNGA